MTRRDFLCGASALGLLALAGAPAGAQSWPTRPVRIVVPFPPGGTTDILARVVGLRLSEVYGQQFIVENRAGAGGNLGAAMVAKSPPDGYTLFMSTPGPNANNQFLFKDPGFDPQKDFTPIIDVAETPQVIAVSSKLPVNTIAELVAYAQKNPGKLNYASPGNGTIGHLAGELFKQMAKIDMVHVPYKGTAPAVQDLVGGSVEVAVDILPPYLPFIEDGKVKALAITTEKRWFALPGAPTMHEAGFPNYQASTWFALFGPAGLPRDMVAALNRHVNEFIQSPEGQKRVRDAGAQSIGGTPDDLARVVKNDMEKWGPIIKSIGIRLD